MSETKIDRYKIEETMAATKQAISSLLNIEAYQIAGIESVLTPALAIYPEIVHANIEATLRVLGGDANRWRPHVKTSKLGFIMRRMAEHGVTNVKCATTLELLTAAEAGARDILVAYSMVGANARRVRELAVEMPDKRISVLVESREQVKAWTESNISLFIDLNGGMDRTGVEQDRIDEIVKLAQEIEEAGLV